MAETRRYITDVDEACALREAGLLWRDAGCHNTYFIDEVYWLPRAIRGNWRDAHFYGDGFFVLLED